LSEETSEPASGSETPKAASLTSSGVPKHWGIHSAICSGVPLEKMPATARVEPKMARAMPASPQLISSLTRHINSPVGSAKHWAMKSKEYRPVLGRLLDDGPRRLLPLVPLGPAGRTTFSANSWTHFWICS
jgi:hypothetical protein